MMVVLKLQLIVRIEYVKSMILVYKWQFSSMATAATESEAAPVVSAVDASVVVIYKCHMLTSLMHQTKNIILLIQKFLKSFIFTRFSSISHNQFFPMFISHFLIFHYHYKIIINIVVKFKIILITT